MDISAYQQMKIRMSTRGKRPLRNLTPSDKVRAIQRIHNGETKASVSRDIGVPESTLRGWCKNEQKLRFMCRQLDTVERLNFMSGIENPPEKRIHFSKHIHSRNIPRNSNEFVYNRLPLNGLPFPSNDNNTISDNITFNDLIKKHVVSENTLNQSFNSFNSHVITSNANLSNPDYYQLPVAQNLLSLLCPNFHTYSLNRTPQPVPYDTAADDTNYIFKILASDINKSNKDADYSSVTNSTNSSSECVKKKGNNFIVNKLNSFSMPISEDSIHPAPFVGLFQISPRSPESERSLIEWCKVFNANLNFMALAVAAATLRPTNATTSEKKILRPNDNIFYKEFRKTHSHTLDLPLHSDAIAKNDGSNDSYFDSEPEDLSVRSGTT